MRKDSIFFLLFLWMGILGCETSKIKDISNSFSPKKLEEVKLGDGKLTVESKIGIASEKREFRKDELWIYDDKSTGSQLGAVTFDAETQRVKGITFVPGMDSKESNLDFLLKQKFANMKFEEIFPNRCQKDFLPASVFYVNKNEGTIVRYNQYSKFVESYSKVESVHLDEVVKNILSCP